jgi:hypothetical protein
LNWGGLVAKQADEDNEKALPDMTSTHKLNPWLYCHVFTVEVKNRIIWNNLLLPIVSGISSAGSSEGHL